MTKILLVVITKIQVLYTSVYNNEDSSEIQKKMLFIKQNIISFHFYIF